MIGGEPGVGKTRLAVSEGGPPLKETDVMARQRPKIAPLVMLILVVATVLVPASLPSEVHAGDVLVPDEWRETHPGPYTITVAVLVDEEWVARFGTDARKQAYAIVRAASRHYEPAGIHLRPVLYETWRSPDDASDIVELLEALELPHRRGEADMVVGLTAGYAGREGGAGRPRGRAVVVKHHPYRTDRDAYILTHEIGHVLGLHACQDSDCLCFMMHGNYDPEKHWCEHHLELLAANGGYFQYLASLPQPDHRTDPPQPRLEVESPQPRHQPVGASKYIRFAQAASHSYS